jgi:tRNA (mo5U34)-methyltransferase
MNANELERANPAEINRYEQRRRYFFDGLLSVTGGSLGGHRVLDLGCNAGYWSLQAVEAGADFVFGLDADQMRLEEAKLAFEAKGIDPARYRFAEASIFEHDFLEQFDVVLCLGLMHHISKPVELFEVIAGVGAEIVVIDTSVSFAPSSFFEVSREQGNPRNAGDYEIILVPTRGAIVELAAEFGFETVPLAPNMTDYTGMTDYRMRRRLAFICAKSASLDVLTRETPPPVIPWWQGMLNPARRGWQRMPRR